MIYTTDYMSSLGQILLAADEIGLVGVWLEGQKYFADFLKGKHLQIEKKETEILRDTVHWLDVYFSGKEPDFLPALHPVGSEFRQTVWRILLEIPYGQTVTYGEIARKISTDTGRKNMSAQAVGGAVGHNPISILIPCHRVVGSNGSLTGHAGGINKKIQLLTLEHADMSKLYVPAKNTSAL